MAMLCGSSHELLGPPATPSRTMISWPTNRTMALNFALLPSVRVKTAFAMKPKAFSPGPTPVRLLSVLVKVP